MKGFVSPFIVMVIFISIGVNSLPPINFTDTVLTNRMIEALSDALVTAHEEQQLTPFQQIQQQLLQQKQQQQLYRKEFQGQQSPHHPFYSQLFSEQQASPQFYPQHLADQQTTEQFYPEQFSEQQASPQFYPQHLADQQTTEQFYPEQFSEQQASHQLFSQQPAEQQVQQPLYQHQSVEQQSQQLFNQQQLPEQESQKQLPEHQQQQFQQSIQPQHHLSGLKHQQQPNYIDSRGYYYPYPYQNVNWYNFPYLWPAIFGGQLDPTAPLAGIGAQLTGLGTSSGCPAGLCPSGAICSLYLGQWQCGCDVNGCVGIQNPCGAYNRYYFPYYPDPSRFIQCDQTGVFWIRKCAPGTIFDPKIGVCNYPPVVVETGKK